MTEILGLAISAIFIFACGFVTGWSRRKDKFEAVTESSGITESPAPKSERFLQWEEYFYLFLPGGDRPEVTSCDVSNAALRAYEALAFWEERRRGK